MLYQDKKSKRLLGNFLNVLTGGDPIADLTNPFFRPQLLKSRIDMLYKTRNSKWALGKYLAVVFLVGFLAGSMAFKPALVPQIPAQAAEMIKVKGVVVDTHNRPLSDFLVKVADAKMVFLTDQLGQYVAASEVPTFPGGIDAFRKFIARNAVYPVRASKASVQGKVLINFVVSATGEIQDVFILKSPGFGLKETSEDLIAAMPAWIPGQQDGKAIATHFSLTVDYQLASDSSKARTIEAQARPDGESGIVAVVTGYVVPREISHNMAGYFSGYGERYGLKNALYVVNGKPLIDRKSPIMIPMDQIASINIIKGATAQKLYGDQGANSVVTIVTKTAPVSR